MSKARSPTCLFLRQFLQCSVLSSAPQLSALHGALHTERFTAFAVVQDLRSYVRDHGGQLTDEEAGKSD